MTTLSASDLLGIVPNLRALAICLVEDQEIADALVELVLVRAWKGECSVAEDDPRMLLFSLLHREFHCYETTRALACLPARPATHMLQARTSDGVRVRSLLRELLPAEREAVLLVEACSFSEAEAAVICECDLWTVRRRVKKASEKLSEGPLSQQATIGPANQPAVGARF